MSERYAKLFSLPENLYAEGAPVIIAAGALLKDAQTGKILAQLKLRSIAPRQIKAVSVRIQPLDTVGSPFEEAVVHQYLDLDTARDGYFGAKSAISLPATARAFTVGVETVVFSDNSVWTDSGKPWEPLQAPRPLASLYSPELVEQFQMEYGPNAWTELLEQKDLWKCVCGADNHANEAKCHCCMNTLQSMREIDVARLKAEAMARMEKQRQEAAEKAERAREQAKKNRKIALIAACAVAVFVAFIVLVNSVIIPTEKYNKAVALMEAGQFEEAIAAFKSIDSYKNGEIKIAEYKYLLAEEALSAGKISHAAMLFGAAGYKDSKARSMELWDEIVERETISVDSYHTVGLKSDGTVVAVGDYDYGQCDVSDWSDIVAICCDYDCTIGLKSDGTVVAVGNYDYGQCDVSDWPDIVAIDCDESHAVGLKSDGTVVAVGDNYYGQCDVSDWLNIVAIYCGGYHTVGLKSDGTVVAVGWNYYGQCDVSDWTDVVAVCCGYEYTVGLKSDGTVVAVGDNYNGQCDVSDWSDIELP